MKNVIPVPKDKWILKFLAEMGNRTDNARIYLDANIVRELMHKCDGYQGIGNYIKLTWNYLDRPSKSITFPIEIETEMPEWVRVHQIDAEDIAFTKDCDEPEEVLWLKNEE